MRLRFAEWEPCRSAEAILADLVEGCTNALDDLFAEPLPSLPLADLVDRGIAEPLQQRVATPWPEAVQCLFN